MAHATGAIVPNDVIEKVIDRLRKNVDALDDEIIESLVRRREYSESIRRQKAKIGAPLVDLKRENEIYQRYIDALGAIFGMDIARAVLAYSKDDLS